MKNPLSLITLVLLFSTALFAQQTNADWKQYKGDFDDFVVEFPAPPKSSVIKNRNIQKQLGNLYKVYLNGNYFFVVACDNSDCPQLRVVKLMSEELKNSPDSKLSEKRLNDSTIETHFLDTEGFSHRVRQISTPKSLFLLHAVGEISGAPEADRFLNSFRIETPGENAASISKEQFLSLFVDDRPDPTKPLAPTPEAAKTPARSPTPPVTPATSDVQSKPVGPTNAVGILSKPMALFSEAALAYEISGEVWLRTTFAANGRIYSIKPWKKLPFGLTRQAVNAAELIKFTPAMRVGVPYSVTKPVVYRFTIY